MGVKTPQQRAPLMFAIRRLYYRLVSRLSEIELTKISTASACTTAW